MVAEELARERSAPSHLVQEAAADVLERLDADADADAERPRERATLAADELA